MGALDTTNERDNAHLSYQGLGSRNVNVRVEEDTAHDSETSYAVEAVSYDDDQRAVHRRYDAYGLQWTDERGLNSLEDENSGNDLATDHRFTGHPSTLLRNQKADGTGLMYYNARYYDPEIGQFISPDSIVPDPTNVFAYNRYMYVYGNPLKYSGPSGHCALSNDGSQDANDGEC